MHDGSEHEQPRARVLIIDDDRIVADSLRQLLEREGFDVEAAPSGTEALAALDRAERAGEGPTERARPFHLALCDQSMPGMDGLETLRRIRRQHPAVGVLMLTGFGAIPAAVEALRAGACDYMTKPVVDEELRVAIERALRQQALMSENVALRKRLDTTSSLEHIVGSDARMLEIFDLIEAVAPSKTTVLMTGETGAGKSLIARAIHQRSPRRDAPFVEISCGSIPETLLESELFGHVRGAFTGAHADKKGRFLAADGGTIFLDEINSASPGMQLKLLRVLQERKFEPVGSSETVEVDVRVVLASNQPLEALVASGQFRQDLYFRINVVRIDLPPLRERPGDIPALAERFLQRKAAELGRTFAGIEAEVLLALQRYAFPGNVRELENVMERAVVLAKRPTITVDDLPPYILEGSGPMLMAAHVRAGLAADEAIDAPDTPWTPTPLEIALRDPEKRILLKALRANNWNRQETADQLGINRTTLYKKMKTLGLDRIAS